MKRRGLHEAMRPLRVRLGYGALALLVGSVAVLGTWAIVAVRDSQRSRILASETSTARLAASALSNTLEGDLALLTNLAGQPGVAKIFQSPGNSRIASVARELHVLYPQFAGVGVVGAHGSVVSAWPAGAGSPGGAGANVTGTPYFTGVMRSGNPYISGLVPAVASGRASGRFDVVLATPVRDAKGVLVGLLDATLSPSYLKAQLGGDSFGLQGQLVVVGQYGHALTGPAAGASTSFLEQPFVAAGLRGGSGSGTGAVPGFTDDRLVGFAAVPRVGWVVLAEEPLSQLNGPLSGLTSRLVAIGLLVLVAAAAAAALVVQLVRRLARARERAGAMVRSLGEGVARLDPAGRVLEMNPALEAMTGRGSAEWVDRSSADALPLHDDRGRPVRWEDSLIAQALQERKVLGSTGYHLYLGTSDGRRLPVALTAAPIVTDGELEGAVVVVRDVSQEREVDQLKTSLVSTVSHELRTPLTMVQGFSELLLTADHLDEEQRHDALAQIHSSALRLGRLIDDLLSVSRIESGRLTADLEPVELAPLIAEAVTTFPTTSASRLVTDVEPGLPQVLADRDKTLQVVTNLVSNATKYSDAESTVLVAARMAGDHVEVAVTDTGIGMSDDEVRIVFEKFTRADNPAVRKAGGTGLGLYITKSLVELQGGQLWVESRTGEGSTFTFSLPLSPTAGGVAAVDGRSERGPAAAPAGAADRATHEPQGVA